MQPRTRRAASTQRHTRPTIALPVFRFHRIADSRHRLPGRRLRVDAAHGWIYPCDMTANDSRWHALGMERIHVSSGPYVCGPDEEGLRLPRFLEAQSPMTIELPAFLIARTPVTNAQYAAFIADTSHAPPEHWARVGTTTPVGAYSPAGDSPYGCQDMAGNVQEWTASPSGAIQGSSRRSVQSPRRNRSIVLRGTPRADVSPREHRISRRLGRLSRKPRPSSGSSLRSQADP